MAAAGCSRTSREAAEPVAKHAAAGPVFRDVTREAKLSFVHSVGPRSRLLPEDMGSGLAWGDFDNDGYADLYVVNQAGAFGSGKLEGPGDRLYHNNGDGTFTDVTERAGLEFVHFGMGAYWGDYDNDGLLDLFVTGVGGCRLYHNEGNGRFRDVTRQSGVLDPLWSSGAVWVDFDGDGWLDLYVLHYVDYPTNAAQLHFPGENQYGVVVPAALNPQSFRPQPNRLLRNNHDGTFTDVTRRAGVADADGRSLTVAAADFNLDGVADLASALAGGRNREEVLSLMQDGRVRAIGVVSLVMVLLLKYVSLHNVPGAAKVAALILMPAAGRWVQVVL